MECQLPAELYDSKDAFIFPTPSFKVLFLGDPQLLWNLFRSTVRGLDLVDSQTFQ